MRTPHRRPTRVAIGLAVAATLTITACSSSKKKDNPSGASGSGGGGSLSGQTITYWASNQAPTVAKDAQVLQPELDKFKQQTGVTVKLEVIDWAHLQNRILAATVSGQGPDVLNIGNTWAPSLQATGAFMPFDANAFTAIGGKDQFVAPALATGGAPGKDPTSVPLYGLAYGLYYNKAMFAAKNLQPPTTWQELVSDAKALTDPSKNVYGMALEGGSYTENVHFAFIFGQQNGGNLFDGDKATFTSPGVVAGIKQYVDLMATDKVVNPGNAQYATGPEAATDFAKGKAAMIMSQNNGDVTFQQNGMKPSDYGVVAIPAPSPLPANGKDIATFPAGINVSIFKNSKHTAASEAFVKFLTSAPEQEILGKAFTTLPINTAAKATWTTDSAEAKVFADVLATKAAPLPLTKNEAAMETAVGQAMTPLIAKAATGGSVSDDDIKSAMEQAQAKMPTS
jgi:multiple sugar transport system substrate-binding protein